MLHIGLLEKNIFLKTIYGAVLFSFFVDATGYLSNFMVVDDPILSAITGGIVTGIGSGLIFKAMAAAAGLMSFQASSKSTILLM